MAELRRLTANDYEQYLDRVAELDALHREALPDVFRAPEAGPARTREFFNAALEAPDVLLLGAWVEGELAGYAHALLRVVEEEWIRVGRCFVVIDNLAVAPRWQRAGLGGFLVDGVAEWAKARDATALELDVWEINVGAVRFYEEIGFMPRRRTLARPL